MSVEGIAAFSTAYSQAQLQNEVGMRVMKMSNDQSQVAAQLLTDALETCMQTLSPDAGAHIDTHA